MTLKDQVNQVIFNTIDQINQQQPEEKQLIKSEETVLFGRNGKLDSLGLVNFIVSAEQQIKKEMDVMITLADDRAMAQKFSPLKTIGTLTEYVVQLVEEHANK